MMMIEDVMYATSGIDIDSRMAYNVGELSKALDNGLEKAGIKPYYRMAHFLAQACHETDSWRALEEYASGEAYEGREDLGNVNPGDGVRYKGRGIFMLTGRSNYTKASKDLNLPLVDCPDLASSPSVAVITAVWFWNTRNLSQWAEFDDAEAITRRLNGGVNGYGHRMVCLERAKYALVQARLTDLGFNPGKIDGQPGPKTRGAIKAFQGGIPQIAHHEGVISSSTIDHLWRRGL